MKNQKVEWLENQRTYTDLRSILKEGTRPTVAWIGAGLSVPAKMPTWGQLHQNLCAELKSLASSTIEMARQQELQGLHDAAYFASDFWEAFRLIRNGLGGTSFNNEIRRHIDPTKAKIKNSLYDQLWKLPISGVLNLNLDSLATTGFYHARPK